LEAIPRTADAQLARAFNRSAPLFALWVVVTLAFFGAMAVVDQLDRTHDGVYYVAVATGGSVICLAVCVMNMVAIFRLAKALALPRWVAIAAAGLFLASLLSLILPLVLIGIARKRLRGAGVGVGPLRVPASELAKLPTSVCEKCGYPRVGLGSGARCPECGEAVTVANVNPSNLTA
jgi:hypothetical protein